MKVKDFSVVDLFCGIGGLSHGFVKEKFNVEAGIDSDVSCKYAFETNNDAKFYHEDISKISSTSLDSKFKKNKYKILVGCAPCQPFSIYNRKGVKKNNDTSKSEKWKLLYSFSNLVDDLEPEIISMENVPQLLNFDNGSVFKDFVSRLNQRGYFVTWSIVNAQDYNVPQRRKRLILFGSKFSKINLIESTLKNKKYLTVRDAIGHLPPIDDGVEHPDDRMHKARKLTELSKKRIRASKEGGNWTDWDESLWLDCHKKESGKNFKSVYGRMKWDDVAPTMTTYCIGLNNGRFGHPEQDRAITLREAALLQSFPENYEFAAPDVDILSGATARQIGNAVPVGLGVAIAKSIKKHIKEFERN